eukprot:15465282-Alexandrium_andersonii.AAC.1
MSDDTQQGSRSPVCAASAFWHATLTSPARELCAESICVPNLIGKLRAMCRIASCAVPMPEESEAMTMPARARSFERLQKSTPYVLFSSPSIILSNDMDSSKVCGPSKRLGHSRC